MMLSYALETSPRPRQTEHDKEVVVLRDLVDAVLDGRFTADPELWGEHARRIRARESARP